MENKQVDFEAFKKENFSNSSEFFASLFIPKIKRINILEKEKIIIYDINLDEKFTNPLKKIHGGAIGSLIENLSSSTLFYFTKKNYFTLDLNINYIIGVDYDKDIQIIVKCLKSEGMTSFIDVEIKEKDILLTKAFIIKTIISVKF